MRRFIKKPFNNNSQSVANNVSPRANKKQSSKPFQFKVQDPANAQTLRALKQAHPAFKTEINILLDEGTLEKSKQDLLQDLDGWTWPNEHMKTAYTTEISNSGHTLFRHGPHLEEPQLDERLTSGTIFGEPAPASSGATSYASKFSNYEAMNTMRQQSIDRLNTEKDHSIDRLVPKFNDYVTKNDVLIRADRSAKGPLVTPANDALKAVQNEINEHTGEGLPSMRFGFEKVNSAYTQLRLNRNTHAPKDAIKYYDRYDITLKSPDTIGSGRKKCGTDPIENMEPVTGVRASYLANWDSDKKFNENSDKGAKFDIQKEVQYFPDNSPEGIEGKGYHD